MMRKPNRAAKLRYREKRKVGRLVGLLCWGRALSNAGVDYDEWRKQRMKRAP